MALTAVTLGNFYTTSGGKNVLGSAGGSGLDEQALITALTNSTEVQATQDQTHITANNTKASAFTQLQSLLTTFQGAAAALSNPPGITNLSSNVFSSAVANVGNGGSNYVSVTAEPGATPQTYDISNITSLATSASQASGIFSVASANADATTGVGTSFTPGTITFAGSGATVTVNAGDSLNTIADNFNAVSAQTGISATVVEIDSSHYLLSFNATKTGNNADFDLTNALHSTVASGGAVLAGITLGEAFGGAPSVFQLNGQTITRQTNSISDAISGVTFNLLQESPTDVVYPASVIPDMTAITGAITNFVNAYNALQTFGAQQTQLNANGTFVSSAILASDPTFTSIMNSVDLEVDSNVAGITDSGPTNLSQIGLSFTNQAATSSSAAVTNLLTVNSSTLNTALTTDFTGVQNVFGLHSTSSDANFALYSHTQPIGVTNFTVNLDPANSIFTATYTQNGHSVTSNLTATPNGGFASGFTLTGAAGSALAGTTFLYVSTAAATINMTISQGVADKANIFATSTLAPSTGSIAIAQAGLQGSDKQLNADITNVKSQAAAYQNNLIAQFSALEQAIASSNTLLTSLNANSNAQLESANS